MEKCRYMQKVLTRNMSELQASTNVHEMLVGTVSLSHFTVLFYSSSEPSSLFSYYMASQPICTIFSKSVLFHGSPDVESELFALGQQNHQNGRKQGFSKGSYEVTQGKLIESMYWIIATHIIKDDNSQHIGGIGAILKFTLHRN